MSTVLSLSSGTSQTRELLLAANGYTVLHASDVYAAAEVFRSSTVDVVVVDAGAFPSSGFATAVALKLTQPEIPLLLVADADAEMDDATTPPCDAVMSRLEGPTALLSRLADLIAQTRINSASGVKAASATVSHSQELRARLCTLRNELQKTRKLSRSIRRRGLPD
ncbi:MAG TPA: hypothetical protein VKT29_10995 [Terriglobales bacterium]|nr:hypothetical protein [Terriglobales bacterium]